MRKLAILAATVAAVAVAAPSSAAEVFFDGFEEDPGNETGLTSLKYWDLYIGTSVDVVAPVNIWNITVLAPASGNVLDLDGTPGPAGIVSKGIFDFVAGDRVTLTFDAGGAQRGSVEDLFAAGFFMDGSLASDVVGTGVTVNPIVEVVTVSDGIMLTGDTPFTSSSISFTALGAGSLQIAFLTDSSDNVGPLLDNVRLSIAPVPEASTWAMMVLGIGVVGAAMRRRRNVPATSFV